MRTLICHLSSGALVTSCCQNTFALMRNLKKCTTASHLIRNLVSGERQRRRHAEDLFVQVALEEWLLGSEVSCCLVSREMRRGWTFLSCVSKQCDLFERHLDYRVKELLFKPLKLWGMGDMPRQNRTRWWEVRAAKSRSSPRCFCGDGGAVLLFIKFGSCCMVKHAKSIQSNQI